MPNRALATTTPVMMSLAGLAFGPFHFDCSGKQVEGSRPCRSPWLCTGSGRVHAENLVNGIVAGARKGKAHGQSSHRLQRSVPALPGATAGLHKRPAADSAGSTAQFWVVPNAVNHPNYSILFMNNPGLVKIFPMSCSALQSVFMPEHRHRHSSHGR